MSKKEIKMEEKLEETEKAVEPDAVEAPAEVIEKKGLLTRGKEKVSAISAKIPKPVKRVGKVVGAVAGAIGVMTIIGLLGGEGGDVDASGDPDLLGDGSGLGGDADVLDVSATAEVF